MVYRTVELVQIGLVTVIFSLVVLLVLLVVRGDAVAALAAGSLRVGHVPDGIDLPLFLGALAFAGAGGTVNLAQSNYIKDKGYGMGRWIGRITSPLTGRDEPAQEVGLIFDATASNLSSWRVWWRRANIEHALTFYLLCLLSLALFCLLTYALLGTGVPVSEGFGFLRDEAAALESRFGVAGRRCFVWAGIAVLFSTELALLDAVSRVSADLVKVSFLRGRERWTLSRLYFVFIWGFIGFGVVVLASGLDRPLELLVLSSSLNAFVMFLYSGLLVWMNWRAFRPPVRPSPFRVAVVSGACLFFGYFSLVTLRHLLANLAG